MDLQVGYILFFVRGCKQPGLQPGCNKFFSSQPASLFRLSEQRWIEWMSYNGVSSVLESLLRDSIVDTVCRCSWLWFTRYSIVRNRAVGSLIYSCIRFTPIFQKKTPVKERSTMKTYELKERFTKFLLLSSSFTQLLEVYFFLLLQKNLNFGSPFRKV